MNDKGYKVGIIGYGVVGRGIHRCLKEDVVAIYDPAYPDCADKESFADLDLIVISVPTNSNEDGSCDTSLVEQSLDWVYEIAEKSDRDPVILIKSAIVPSELKRLVYKYENEYDRGSGIVSSPEYMGESKYYTPFWKYPDPSNMESHTWQVYGGDKESTSLCVDIFKRRMSVDTIHIQTDLMTAALCKYMENSFFAMKVTFCNEFYDIAKAYGVDYNELRTCWLADTRINPNHTLVFPKDRGYGGKCFPKDVKAIVSDSIKVGYEPKLMKTVDEINNSFRKDN
jgi:UDPglucose 6-dehydrogenase